MLDTNYCITFLSYINQSILCIIIYIIQKNTPFYSFLNIPPIYRYPTHFSSANKHALSAILDNRLGLDLGVDQCTHVRLSGQYTISRVSNYPVPHPYFFIKRYSSSLYTQPMHTTYTHNHYSSSSTHNQCTTIIHQPVHTTSTHNHYSSSSTHNLYTQPMHTTYTHNLYTQPIHTTYTQPLFIN